MVFEVRDRVMLKVSLWKGVVRFGKRGKLLAKVGKVAYRLKLPQELSRVYHTFHVSNLNKYYANEPLAMPLEGIHMEDKLQFVEEPVEIMEREIKRLKRSRIPLVKVRGNTMSGLEFTWECEDSFKKKYPHLFINRGSSSTTRSYVEALQVKHPIIDWKVHTEGKRSYWKITRLGGSSVSYQFFVDMLKHLDRKDLNQLWRILKESLRNRPPISDKEMELWVELNRLYEPDEDDQLWTHTQNLMHALVEWKLYDSCGVHHVTARDKEIFMLVEKDYPLRKGLAIVMISYKCQVKNYSRMANDLILKIFKIVSTPRQQGD
nr:putative reverse transcriptase domain-containing protein [Tanacetum cinerariifolium]